MRKDSRNGDCLIFGGAIYTMDPERPQAEAVAIKKGRIVYVGDKAGAMTFKNSTSETIELKGRVALPGFVESHSHVAYAARWLSQVEVDCQSLRSVQEVIEALKAKASQMPPGKWLLGFNYDESQLIEKRYLNRFDLDQVSKDRPIWVRHFNFHVHMVNTAALRASGISSSTPDPPDGEIDRDPSGEPNGVLKEFASLLVRKSIPADTVEEICSHLQNVGMVYLPAGVTSVVEGGLGLLSGVNEIRATERILETGHFPFRYGAAIYYPFWKELGEGTQLSPVWNGDPEWVRLFAVKLFRDGGLFTGPALSAPAHSQNKSGDRYLLFSKEDFEKMVLDAHGKGWQVWTHANGDLAIQTVLDAYEAAMKTLNRPHPRHRLEHCQLPTEEQLDRMASMGVLPSFFPAHIWHWGDRHLVNLGPERASRLSPMNSALKRGLRVGMHNDSPFTPMEPLVQVSSAVLRRSKNGEVLGEEQRISVEEALKAVTLGNAFLSFEEGTKGSFQEGKFGDVVVLEADPFKVKREEIKDIPVALTIVGGKIAYKKG